MDAVAKTQSTHPRITEYIFANSPTMLALCLTMLGLIKIYSSLERVTTLIDNFLVACLVAFLLSTIFSYLALRSRAEKRKIRFAGLADASFLAGLLGTTTIAFFVVYSLAG